MNKLLEELEINMPRRLIKIILLPSPRSVSSQTETKTEVVCVITNQGIKYITMKQKNPQDNQSKQVDKTQHPKYKEVELMVKKLTVVLAVMERDRVKK